MIAAPERPSLGTKRSLTFGIGNTVVRVDSVLPEIIRDLSGLYELAGDDPAAVHVQVTRGGTAPWSRSFEIHGDDRRLYSIRRRNSIFPYLEWGINTCVRSRRMAELQFHAAGLSRHGQGVVLAGESGCGKSTLTAALLARGWGYYCDELTFVDTDTLQLQPFPKALCIKAGSFPVMRRLGLPLAVDRCYVKKYKGRVAYLSPTAVSPGSIAAPVAARWVIFPRYCGAVQPELQPISSAQAAFGLARCGLNKRHHGPRAIAMISAMVRGARCFELRSGDITATCDLLEQLVSPGC